jgi:hypothetical protein
MYFEDGEKKLKYFRNMCDVHVSLDMLFRGSFIAANPKNIFGNPDWFIEWLGTAGLVFRPENPTPPFLWQPPPPLWRVERGCAEKTAL